MRTLRYLFLLLAFSFAKDVFATHNRAGEITYKWVGHSPTEYKYEVTITTYTKTSSAQADRPSLDSVHWGDGSNPVVFVRDTFIDLPNDIRHNIYINTHTYNGNGRFKISFTDPNRNADVVNIPHSVSVPFYLETLLIINPFVGPNNSPVLTYPPIDQGCKGRIFIHNAGAYDPDGTDIFAYRLVECRGDNGTPIGGYAFPSSSHSFSLDPVTGDLVWDSPIEDGEYNVAFEIIELRNGDTMGIVLRDMQIVIKDCDNRPPVIETVNDTCVLAGDTLRFTVRATDIDGNNVALSGSGGIFDSILVPDPATLIIDTANNDTVVSTFEWATKCHHIRPQPYFVQFRAVDSPTGTSPPLVDLKGTFIRVIPPAPPNVIAVASGSAIDIAWSPAPCGGVAHYNIYKRNGQYPDTIHCPCDNGVPAFTGYTLLGTTTDGNDTTFTDDNGGQGLSVGVEYCYLITATYPDGSESCASPQTCASLIKDAPVITNADVRFTDPVNGSVFIGWSKPTELDTIQFPGPYEYRVFHSTGFSGASFSQIAVFNDLNDTAFIDTLIDTKSQPWSYKIDFYYTNAGVLTQKGNTAVASTIFLTIAPTDNQLNLTWEEHVPWINNRYDIFKQNASLTFDSIASVTTPSYSDTGLVNGTQYCYFIRSSGFYSLSGFIDPILNRSQQECSVPFDNVPPCAPDLSIASDCNNGLNQLVWTNPNNSCADDVQKYYIYFGPSEEGGFERIDSVLIATDTIYNHVTSILSGCYKVTAVDSVGNETPDPEVVCVDTCRQYVLPSVFTPDGNGKNDLFHPCDSTTAPDLQLKNCPAYKNVKSVEMKIFNRWGSVVYKTTDKNINWDGKNMDTQGDCPDGVYYYTCKVNFFSIKEEQSVELHGTVQLIRD